MPDALFDSYLIVDWSARSVPGPARPAKDSIWWTLARRGDGGIAAEPPAYARTRAEAVERLASLLDAERRAGRRLLAGFDFPFGYPAGVAGRLTGTPEALALWGWLAGAIEDDAGNRDNRYAVAERINSAWDGRGPMWGRPAHWHHPDVPVKARERQPRDHPPENRLADERAQGAKTVWQLAYNGSVGSQVLLGLPALERLRADPRLAGHLAVWPFETGLAAPEAPIVLAEVYPSLIRAAVAAARREGEVPDAAQTRVNALAFARLDAEGDLAPLFAGPPDLSPAARRLVETEEAWILGLGEADRLAVAARAACADAPPDPKVTEPAPLRYERDPAAIYRQSWEAVRAETRLDHLPEDLRQVAIRLVHACGMPEIANRLAWDPDLAAAAGAALAAGAPVLCDCEAVASGIVRARLPAANRVLCNLNDSTTASRAEAIGNTRSAAAVELWHEHLAGALAVIGNAPTALFHLLELIDAGWPRPAAILAFPVGFVGAAESKAELARNPRGIPFLTLRGRRGGSAMAAAAVNALAAGLEAPR